jgi:hypothetical protein
VQFHAFPFAALPLAVLERRVGLGNIARLGQQQRHGLLGGRQDVGHGRVDDHDAEFGGLGDVDVIEADPRAPDHDHVTGRFEGRGVDVGRRADDQGVRAGNRFEELGRRQTQLDVDFVTGVA